MKLDERNDLNNLVALNKLENNTNNVDSELERSYTVYLINYDVITTKCFDKVLECCQEIQLSKSQIIN